MCVVNAEHVVQILSQMSHKHRNPSGDTENAQVTAENAEKRLSLAQLSVSGDTTWVFEGWLNRGYDFQACWIFGHRA